MTKKLYEFIYPVKRAIEISVQSVIWSIISRFKDNDKTIDDRKKLIDDLIFGLKEYIDKNQIFIYPDSLCKATIKINPNIIMKYLDSENHSFMRDDFGFIDSRIRGYDKLQTILSCKYNMGADIQCQKNKNGKYKFTDNFTFSTYLYNIFDEWEEKETNYEYKQFIDDINEDDIDDLTSSHTIKYTKTF